MADQTFSVLSSEPLTMRLPQNWRQVITWSSWPFSTFEMGQIKRRRFNKTGKEGQADVEWQRNSDMFLLLFYIKDGRREKCWRGTVLYKELSVYVCVSSVPYNTGLQVCQLSKHCICKVVQYSSQFYNRSGLKSPRLSAQCRTPAVVCWSCIAQTFKEAKHKSGLFNKREHSIFQLNVQSKEKVTFGDLRSPLLQLVSILCCLM